MAPKKRMDDTASVGIGTMIVFIATVLVAAIAAAVLIDMSGKLQERSSRTGSEATEQVSSNLNVESIIGQRDATSDSGLKDLFIYVALAPGATSVDLNQLKITLHDGTSLDTIGYSSSATSATAFIASSVRDADSSFSASSPVMTSGDLVKIQVDLDNDADATVGINQQYAPRSDVQITLSPEVGNSVVTGFTTPATYGSDLLLELI